VPSNPSSSHVVSGAREERTREKRALSFSGTGRSKEGGTEGGTEGRREGGERGSEGARERGRERLQWVTETKRGEAISYISFPPSLPPSLVPHPLIQ